MKNNQLFIPLLYTVLREIPRYKRSIFEAISCSLSSCLFYYLWVPIYTLFALGNLTDLGAYLVLLPHFVAFVILYEAGYLISDYCGSKREDRKLGRAVFRNLQFKVLSGAVLSRIAIVLAILFSVRSNPSIYLLHGLTFAIFLVHSLVQGQYRLATFMGLRVLKGFVPYATMIMLLPLVHKMLILSALIGHGIHQAMEYYPRKLGARIIRNYYCNDVLYVRFLAILSSSFLFTVIFGIDLKVFTLFIMFIALHHIFYVTMVDLNRFWKRIWKVLK